MVHISAEIEINRSPDEVRAVLLDFNHWSAWLTTGLAITSPKSKPGLELKPGDRLHSDFRGTVVKPKVLTNTPATFEWRGRFMGVLLIGQRRFFFKKSEKTPGGTTLVQNEDIKGALAFLFKKNEGQGKIAREAMAQFNQEIKARAEAL
ncbi:hypothetical protein C8A01DRAFT_46859 [Parachaetomium inaequale]|uniref:SRPBCC domain-containing protein n=1 Tax=Parachaetomium inaequale TaxID=2588326 RepID=A0AAN6SRT1_9PEZI|nr:hypothetical protein C8A01DRAFT_46859 [Parachaetomium inaequale]